MTFPAVVHPANGQFEAALVGAPDVRAVAQTRDAALAALESVIAQRLDSADRQLGVAADALAGPRAQGS